MHDGLGRYTTTFDALDPRATSLDSGAYSPSRRNMDWGVAAIAGGRTRSESGSGICGGAHRDQATDHGWLRDAGIT
jgi:hypothetical protein